MTPDQAGRTEQALLALMATSQRNELHAVLLASALGRRPTAKEAAETICNYGIIVATERGTLSEDEATLEIPGGFSISLQPQPKVLP